MKLNTNSGLKLISLFPLMLLLSWSIYFAYNNYNEYQSGIQLKNRLYSNQIIKNLSLNLARERGLSATYYGSNGKLAIDALRRQRLDTDQAIKKFKNYYNEKETSASLSKIHKMLSAISKVRMQTDKLTISFDKMFFDYYSVLNAAIMDEYRKILNDKLTPQISSYIMYEIKLFSEMEKSGQERGFISYVIAKKRPFSMNEYVRWIKLFTQADFSKLNIQLATPEIKKRLQSLFNSSKAKELYTELTQAKINIIEGSDIGYYQIEPEKWFSLMTSKIKLLNTADNVVSREISKNIESLFNNKTKPLFIVSVILLILSIVLMVIGYFIDRYIRSSIKELEKLFTKVGQLADIDEEIDFQTTEGIEKGYRIIEIAIDQIQQDKQTALEASKAKSIFLANMSHEIRTPLNGIIGFTELLKNTDISGEKRDFVDIIEKSSENLLEIINNILDLSKIESDKIEVEEILFSPITEFENAVEVFGAKAAEKNIRLSFYMDPSLNGYLNGDPTKIKEVLINLISNAIKFTPVNGEIDVEIKRVGTSGALGKTKVQFVVKDNGIGISEDKIKTIFDAFSQADSTITRKYGGTGLGLTISSKFIAMMGGRLEVESEVGKGAKFFFTLEFDESPSSENNYQDKFLEFKCALLANEKDKKNHTQYIYDYLKFFGCEVTFFYDCNEIKGLIFRENINFLILDVDYLDDSDISKYKDANLPGIIILKSSMQSLSSKYSNDNIKSVYEPVNVTKLATILEKISNLLTKKRVNKTKPMQKRKKEIAEDLPRNELVEDIPVEDAESLHILVAEDNEINRKLIKKTLENYGANIMLAENGQEAVEAVHKRKFDLIFMDIAMPVMDGVEALHEILNYEVEKGLKHTPIVALTANALKGDRERFLKEGFDEYITKPIKKDRIETILSMFVKSKLEKIKSLKDTQDTQENDAVVYSLKTDEEKKIVKEESEDYKSDETQKRENKQIDKEIESTNIVDDMDDDFFKATDNKEEDFDKDFEDFFKQDAPDLSNDDFFRQGDDFEYDEEIKEEYPTVEENPLEQPPNEPETTKFQIKRDIDDFVEDNKRVVRALTVEDNPINQKLIEKTLKNLGLEVEIANNGEEGVKKFINSKFDIIFMDISMPVMDGIEATHEILAYEKEHSLKHTPIVALTANALPGDREAFLSEGLDEYISKPLKKEDIERILKIFLGYEQGKSFDSQENSENDKNIQEPLEFENQQLQEVDVLVFKNNIIEAKILNNMITRMGYKVDFIHNYDEFMYNIDTKIYKIIFFDKDIDFVKSDEIIQKIKNTDDKKNAKSVIVEFVNSSDEVKDSDALKVDEILDNIINKKKIRLILEKYIR